MNQEIHITQLKIKKNTVSLGFTLKEPVSDISVNLVCRNPAYNLSYPFQCTVTSGQVTASLDVSSLTLAEGDWDVLVSIPGKAPFSTILGGRLRARLLLGNYRIIKDQKILFPMGSVGHRFILRCRPVSPYDHGFTRFKEFAAFGLSRILKPFFQKKHLWLVYEKYCVSAQDNGFYFFQYCMEQLPENRKKNIFFILDKKSAQWNQAQEYSRNVIPFMSFRHILYLLLADIYVASDSRLHAYAWQPMPNLISRESNRHDIYFLQHGVLALKRVENLFGKNGSSSMTYFTASSEFEKNIIVKEFGYEPEQVPVTGLCRWDVLKDRSASTSEKSILVMPTWRSWLEEQNEEIFCQSDYYHHYSALLKDPELLNLLEKQNLKLIFYIHPKLREHLASFHSDNSHIRLIPFGNTPLNQLLMDCSMLITDYSSVSWDIYYMEKPILFYQFDLEQYNETNGSYIDMDKELYGDRCMTQSELIRLIRDYSQNGFQEKKFYGDMRKHYFAYRDHNNCKRTFDFLIKNGY